MPHTYSYSVSSDLSGGKVHLARLSEEIVASAIVTALDRAPEVIGGDTNNDGVTNGGTLYITFESELSAGDKTILDNNTTAPAGGLLASHLSAPLLKEDHQVEVTEHAVTTASYQTIHTFTSAHVLDGSYRIDWYAEIKASPDKKQYVRVMLDGSIVVGEGVYKEDEYMPISGFTKKSLTNGQHTIEFQIKGNTNVQTSFIREMRYLLRRVGA